MQEGQENRMKSICLVLQAYSTAPVSPELFHHLHVTAPDGIEEWIHAILKNPVGTGTLLKSGPYTCQFFSLNHGP